MTQIPQVLSVSWGGGESQYPIAHQTSANKCFQKLGSMGVSIFAAAGDDGTGKQGFFGRVRNLIQHGLHPRHG